MQLSKFGEKFTAKTGILQLMDDLGSALSSGEEVLMLGGGNPSYIPQVQACFREKMAQLFDDGNRFERMVGDYASPSGSRSFAEAIATLLRQMFGWQITADNIALTNGSQNAFFCLFNLFAILL